MHNREGGAADGLARQHHGPRGRMRWLLGLSLALAAAQGPDAGRAGGVCGGALEPPTIYVLSVARHEERWQRLLRNTAPALRPYLRRWPAHDGAGFGPAWLAVRNASLFPGWELPLDDPAMSVLPGRMEKWSCPVPYNVWYWARPITAGEAALALSSHEVWQDVAGEGGPAGRGWAVVLEDDVIVNVERLCRAVAVVERALEPGAPEARDQPWLVYLATGALTKLQNMI